MRAVSPNDLTPDAPYSVIVSVDNCRFQHLNDKEVEIIREQFKVQYYNCLYIHLRSHL